MCNEEVYQLLSSLDVTKANGPDGISARTLKHNVTSISPLIMKLFNLSLHTGHIPSECGQYVYSSSDAKMCCCVYPIIIKCDIFFSSSDSSVDYSCACPIPVQSHSWTSLERAMMLMYWGGKQ